jgi:tRNA(Ile)-lysidine synthase
LGVVKQFLNHIQRHKLCKTNDKILLAVSGGVDSMVMLHLFMNAGFSVGVAHCNFKLRGKDSDEDENLVKRVCEQSGIAIHSESFDTTLFAAQQRLSIQLAARELRYQFFRGIAAKHEYQVIATAHHLNDNLETVILNLVRGTGLEGIKGIPVKNRDIIRPLLFASREQILDYAKVNGIEWREDVSNEQDYYNRNFVRNQVVPMLKSLNPNLEQTFSDSIERVNAGYVLFQQKLKEVRSQISRENNTIEQLPKAYFATAPYGAALLYEFIKYHGFHFDQCQQIITEHQSGKIFQTAKATLIIDREFYIIERKQNSTKTDNIILHVKDQSAQLNGAHLKVSFIDRSSFFLQRSSSIAQLDADLVHFPLTWRSWREGDRFVPLGMHAYKKVSDYLIDQKIPVSDKNKVTVMECNGEIIWLVGHRISDRFKITEKTARVMVMELAAV